MLLQLNDRPLGTISEEDGTSSRFQVSTGVSKFQCPGTQKIGPEAILSRRDMTKADECDVRPFLPSSCYTVGCQVAVPNPFLPLASKKVWIYRRHLAYKRRVTKRADSYR